MEDDIGFLNAMAEGNLASLASLLEEPVFLNAMAMGNVGMPQRVERHALVLKRYGDGKRIFDETLCPAVCPFLNAMARGNVANPVLTEGYM